MGYAEQESIEAGLPFKTPSGLIVKTTGSSLYIQTVQKYVHEVVIVEGTEEGRKFFHNLDSAEPL